MPRVFVALIEEAINEYQKTTVKTLQTLGKSKSKSDEEFPGIHGWRQGEWGLIPEKQRVNRDCHLCIHLEQLLGGAACHTDHGTQSHRERNLRSLPSGSCYRKQSLPDVNALRNQIN
ncbi:MAG: hypothetical protein Q6361_03685 [Candidatus Hermodarchaeota archaeon]|nr:hypothetical protein [Candidatus Hermodarchaeota archaeon]